MSSSTAPAEKKPKARRTRRNYQRELDAISTYCKVNVEILETLRMETVEAKDSPADNRIDGKLQAFKAVLSKLEQS